MRDAGIYGDGAIDATRRNPHRGCKREKIDDGIDEIHSDKAVGPRRGSVVPGSHEAFR
jgi:hypothetical protein